MPKLYSGKWGRDDDNDGLPATVIALLMNCSASRSRQKLNALKISLGRRSQL
jgi:hypothetical protein